MTFLVVAGARPNFMKIAPIIAAFDPYRGRHQVILLHTGQHYDPRMSDNFFRDLEIPEPDINLGVGSGSHAEQTARVMIAFEKVCLEQAPDWVVVVGDVNSTMACAITAKKAGVKVAHVEAGLRSRDMAMPEEINRLCTDVICDLLFTTDEIASENLRREGVAEDKIRFVGNTMIDTLLKHVDRARLAAPLNGYKAGEFAVVTLHRPSNVDDEPTLRGILGAIEQIAEHLPVLLPAHPRTVKNLSRFGMLAQLESNPHIKLMEPLSYLPFIGLVAQARLVLTDSGGIQEETTVLGIPCLTMRDNTERPITCQQGTNSLVGADPARILKAARVALARSDYAPAPPPKWDGHAAERIVDILTADDLVRTP